MTVAAAPSNASPSLQGSLSRLLMAGLAGGAVDFLYASIMAVSRGRPVTMPWRSVAGGWIGKAAADGAGPVILGVVTHFGIAICMAAAWIHLAWRVPIVAARPWATAPVYGLILYAVMYLGVLPLRFGNPWQWRGTLSVLAIVALAVRRRAQ